MLRQKSRDETAREQQLDSGWLPHLIMSAFFPEGTVIGLQCTCVPG